ncbi:MAG: potassium-transporting ATPase subunit KdpA [Egibacteraceae bacterium]
MFNTGSAHPLANPNGVSNTFELVLALGIPFAFPLLYGRLTRPADGCTIVAVMALLWLVPLVAAAAFESDGNPRLETAGVMQELTVEHPGGNLEGKEIRLGSAGSALLTIGTTPRCPRSSSTPKPQPRPPPNSPPPQAPPPSPVGRNLSFTFSTA